MTTTAEDIKRLADTYADGPHTEGYFGAHRNALHAAIDSMAAQLENRISTRSPAQSVEADARVSAAMAAMKKEGIRE